LSDVFFFPIDYQESPAFHVTFIKLASNVSDAAIDAALDGFLALADELDYVTQLTAGEL
jgi:hypothetical protein